MLKKARLFGFSGYTGRIYPDYRRNPSELAAIKRTVDVVKNDANTTVTEIDIVGYASPEGRYAANARLVACPRRVKELCNERVWF